MFGRKSSVREPVHAGMGGSRPAVTEEPPRSTAGPAAVGGPGPRSAVGPASDGSRPPSAAVPEASEGAGGWFESTPEAAVGEPTQILPVVAAPRPRRPPPPSKAVARAVIVYEERPRAPWRLWVFTAVLVSLTVGVILGQTVTFEPTYRSTANAQTVVVPPAGAPPAPPAVEQPWPDAQHRVTAPLGPVRTRLLEVVGASTSLHVRSADLGDTLLDVATTDRGAMPRLTDTEQGSRLELVPTGNAGTVGATIQLNADVAWTLRLTGGAFKQDIDMRAGGVAGITIAGGTAHVVVQLPAPKGTVPLSLTGPVGELAVRTEGRTPVRLRLEAGAGTAVLDGRTHRKVRAGTALTSATWRSVRNRYDVTLSDAATSVRTAAS